MNKQSPVRVLVVIAVVILAAGVCWGMGRKEDFDQLRKKMVAEQLTARGITDRRVLEVMRRIQRHKFVPADVREFAYEDGPLSIGEGQTISQPYIVALMSELLRLEGSEKVLEIGTGSGYQAAILAELAQEVYTIELIPSLAQSAEKLLTELGYENIHVKAGDGYKGWPEQAPFEGIIVTAAPPEIPETLIEQLAEGGRMVVPVGMTYQELILVTKKKGSIERSTVIPVRFVPMVHGRD